MSAVVMEQCPKSIVEAPEVAQAMRHAEKALALLRSGCPRLARLELGEGVQALDAMLGASSCCPACGRTGLDEDARCEFCDGTGRKGGGS